MLLVLAGVAAAPAWAAKEPTTTITSGPSGTVASTSATFTFTTSGGSYFQCKLDGSTFSLCSSPKSYSGLAQGGHTFAVRAVAKNGTVDSTPATRSWTVDTVAPPAPSITSGPSNPSGSSSAAFTFTDAEAGVGFLCSLDDRTAVACSSPEAYSALVDGSHTFSVSARDAAGNRSAAVSATWVVDLVGPPMPTVDSASTDVNGSNATFAFSDSEAGATFVCGLDGSLPTACTSPQSYGPLADGRHVFSVQAVDAAGNPSPAVTETWTADSSPVPPTEYISNGTFDNGGVGWGATNGALSVTSDGNSGSAPYAIKVAAGTAGTEYWLYAQSRPVSSTTQGVTYTTTGYVRSDTPGKLVCTRMREYTSAGTRLSEVKSCVTTTVGWQAVPPLAYTAQGSGDTIAFQVFQSAPAAGDSFEADGLSMTAPGPEKTAPPIFSSNDPTLAAAGDIACSPDDPGYNSGLGTGGRCMQSATAKILSGFSNLSTLLTLGDEQYACGEATNFSAVYALTWGRFRSITRPVPGNHEYGDTASCTASNASGYYSYYGANAGDPTQGYYSYDIGAWHLIAINSNCAAVGGCAAGSPQESWLKADLAAHPNACTLAYWHHPRFSAGQTGDDGRTADLWTDLVNARADLVLVGHDHTYQRYAQMGTGGGLKSTGVREIVVGTGGEEHHLAPLSRPAVQVADNTTFGVLKLTLGSTGYLGTFVNAPGTGSFTDSFTGSCVQ